jgi:hypothetical protein
MMSMDLKVGSVLLDSDAEGQRRLLPEMGGAQMGADQPNTLEGDFAPRPSSVPAKHVNGV